MRIFLCLLLLFSLPAAASPSLQEELLDLCNQARHEAGLAPLQGDANLERAAQQHSAEMDSLHYFGHRSPLEKYATLAKRLVIFGFYGSTSAENLYRDESRPSAQRIVRAWLASPAHRHNLLNERYNRVGLGISRVGEQWTVTQDLAYLPIEVLEKQVVPKPLGLHVRLHCQVQAGPQHGALLYQGRRCANWQANAEGHFQLEVDLPGPGVVALGQADGERSWIVETEFPVQ